MNTKLLRQQILDLAIRGKLVKQDPNDEPASVLLERIRAEKEQLIQQGKIKKTKAPATTDTPHYQNTPFDIPKNWKWVRLGEVAINRDSERIPLSTEVRKKQNNKQHDYYGASGVIDKVSNYLFNERLLLVGEDGANLLSRSKDNAFFAEGKYWVNNHAHVIDCIDKTILDYIAIVINATPLDKYITGSAQPKFTQDNLNNFPIPLPPIAEQRRIVAEVERLFALIDDLEANKQDLQSAIKQVRAKVLDLAIHGKLVSQDPNDEPAIDLLRRINPHFAPSDTSHYQNIPQGWEVCRLEDAFEIVMGSSPNGSSLNMQKQGVEFHQGKICFTDMYLQQSNTYTDAPTKFAEPNSVLLCVRAPVGVVNLTDRKVCIGRGLCALKPRQGIDLLFGFYALQTHKEHFDEQATGTTFKAIGGNTIRRETFLLPPYNEQIRIRERIETILQQLDTISAEL